MTEISSSQIVATPNTQRAKDFSEEAPAEETPLN